MRAYESTPYGQPGRILRQNPAVGVLA